MKVGFVDETSNRCQPFVAYQIMLRVFYTLGDTRTPALVSVGVSAVTIATCSAATRLTPGPNLVIALAACSAIAYATGLVVTAQLLRYRIGRGDGHRLLSTHTRMLAAAAIAALAAAVTATETAWAGSLVTVCTAAAAGGGLYALAARGLRITEFKALTAALRSRNT